MQEEATPPSRTPPNLPTPSKRLAHGEGGMHFARVGREGGVEDFSTARFQHCQLYPHVGVRRFHRTSTCNMQLSIGPHVVQFGHVAPHIWVERNPRSVPRMAAGGVSSREVDRHGCSCSASTATANIVGWRHARPFRGHLMPVLGAVCRVLVNFWRIARNHPNIDF